MSNTGIITVVYSGVCAYTRALLLSMMTDKNTIKNMCHVRVKV